MTSVEANPQARKRPKLSDSIRDAVLRDLLLSGEIPPGNRLPTEAELCRRYNASRVTVRAALRSLQEAGYIAVRQGLGSTVLPRPQAISSGLDRLSSLETFAAAQGAKLASEDLVTTIRGLDDKESALLERPSGTRAIIMGRAKVFDGDRVAWIVDYVPEGVLPFEMLQREFRGSVLDILLAQEQLGVEYSDCDLDTVALPADVAAHLNVDPGTPAMYMSEVTRTSTGEAVNMSFAWLLPGFFRLHLRRKRQFGG
jgi:DNA-binding GntR family transcriptional regulator